jgi:hypothetical protein
MTKKIFRYLLAVEIILVVFAVIVPFTLESSLPVELQNYLSDDLESKMSTIEIVNFFICLSLLIYCIWNYIHLFKFSPTSRKHATIVTILWYVAAPSLEPTVSHGIAMMICDMSLILWGSLLGAMYYSELKSNYSFSVTQSV